MHCGDAHTMMDGIYGWVTDGAPDNQVFDVLSKHMSHRVTAPGLSLGRCQLAAPVVLAEGHLLAGLCGWIGAGLAADQSLSLRGLLARYRESGSAALHDVRGEFVLAIWDNHSHTLVIIRDTMGVKPLYYQVANGLVFASEQSAVARATANRQIDEARVCDLFLQYEYADFETSLFRNMKRLPPGHELKWQRLKPAVTRASRLQRRATHDQSLSELAAKLEVAVSRRLGPRENAVLLSGGLDSALIAAALARLNGDCRTISAVSRHPEDDCDTHAIAEFERTFTGRHQHVTESSDPPLQLLQQFDELDDPFGASNAMLLTLMTQAARHGVDHLLDGVEGDLVFSLGREYLATLAVTGQFHSLAAEMIARHRHFATPWLIDELITLRSALTPHPVRAWRHARLYPKNLLADCESALLSKSLTDVAMHRYPALFTPTKARRQDPDALHEDALAQPYIAVALERYDKTAAVSGVSLSHPLLDVDLVEFALSLPWHKKRQHGWNKFMLRQLGEQWLTPTLAWRKQKPHLGGSFTAALQQALRPTIGETLNELQEWREYLNSRQVFALLKNPAGQIHDEQLWYVFTFARWLARVHREN